MNTTTNTILQIAYGITRRCIYCGESSDLCQRCQRDVGDIEKLLEQLTQTPIPEQEKVNPATSGPVG